jgi:hypothetical protein
MKRGAPNIVVESTDQTRLAGIDEDDPAVGALLDEMTDGYRDGLKADSPR